MVDVRTPEERAEGTIEGSIEIVLDELMQRADDIPRDRPVVFYCRSGSRSYMAAQAFRQGGYDAYSMAGGFEAWAKG